MAWQIANVNCYCIGASFAAVSRGTRRRGSLADELVPVDAQLRRLSEWDAAAEWHQRRCLPAEDHSSAIAFNLWRSRGDVQFKAVRLSAPAGASPGWGCPVNPYGGVWPPDCWCVHPASPLHADCSIGSAARLAALSCLDWLATAGASPVPVGGSIRRTGRVE